MALDFPNSPTTNQIHTANGKSWTWNGTYWSAVNAGVQGAQGTQGHQGIQGTQGIQGITGSQGAQGLQGAQGRQGIQGTQGQQGITGSQGAQGLQGITGSQGTQGQQGITGSQGTQGNQGIQGITGSQGTQGQQGIQGRQGIQGNQGITGSGAQGTQGQQGITGSQGTQGNQGITGAGAQGTQGQQGIAGSQGTQGNQGITGAGVQGAQGTVGSSGSSNLLNATANTTSSPLYPVMVTATGSNQTPYATTTSGYFQFNASTGGLQISQLGVGTAPSGTAGEILATNNITAYYSDERLKTRIGKIEDPIEKVKALSGFYFVPNDTAVALGYDKKIDLGVSAQEVAALFPEIIAPAPIDSQYMTVRYEKLIPLLIEAIKDQQKQIEDLRKSINTIT